MKRNSMLFNQKGITLVELIATIAVLAVITLILVQSMVFGVNLIKTGSTIMNDTVTASNDFEGANANYTTSAGTFVFTAGGTQISVNGNYDTQVNGSDSVLARFRVE